MLMQMLQLPLYRKSYWIQRKQWKKPFKLKETTNDRDRLERVEIVDVEEYYPGYRSWYLVATKQSIKGLWRRGEESGDGKQGTY